MSRFSVKGLFSKALDDRSDDELMQLIVEGQAMAFETLFDRHSGKVLAYSRRLLGGVEKAEDLAQDVWMKVIRYADRYQSRGQFIAWLYTMIRNTAFNELKKQKNWNTDIDEIAEIPAEDQSPEAWLSEQQDVEELKKKVDALPARQRAVIVMSLSELSYEEMASELEMTVSAVKSLLFRARRSLQETTEESA